MTKENELVEKPATPLASTLGEGFTGLQAPEVSDTIRLPRLILPQDKAKIVKNLGAKPGLFINTLTMQEYGATVDVVPLIQRKNTRIRWGAREAGGGITCINRNRQLPSGDPGDQVGACERCPHFMNFDAETGCTDNYEIVALVRNDPDPRFWEPVIIAAESKRPSDQGFRDIIAIARLSIPRGIKLWHKAYELKGTTATNKHGEFYKVACRAADNNAKLPADVIAFLDQQVAFYANAKIEASHEDGTSAGGEAGAGDVPKDW